MGTTGSINTIGRDKVGAMNPMTTVLLTVTAGDIVLVDGSDFPITEVREPTNPAAPGLVWHGSWWRADLRHWGPPTLLHMHEGKPLPHLLTPAEREACGWSELP